MNTTTQVDTGKARVNSARKAESLLSEHRMHVACNKKTAKIVVWSQIMENFEWLVKRVWS